MNFKETLEYQVIYNVNNFPVGKVPQNMSEVEAKIAVVSSVLSLLDFDGIENSEFLNVEDRNQREINYRAVISHAYALDETEIPILPIAVRKVVTSLDYLSDYDKIAYAKEYDSTYKNTYDSVLKYSKNVYEVENQKHL